MPPSVCRRLSRTCYVLACHDQGSAVWKSGYVANCKGSLIGSGIENRGDGGERRNGIFPTIEADATQMRQLMQNLIGNALKFRHLDMAPIIKISAESVSSGKGRSNGSYQIKVEDNGIGFDQKYVDKIFTVFQRLHGRTEYEGSGVGLAVCRKIAERHNGQITAQGIEGKGATFVVTLPAKQTQMEENNEIQS